VIRDNLGNVINYAKSCDERPACSSYTEIHCSQQTDYQTCHKCFDVADSCFCRPSKFLSEIKTMWNILRYIAGMATESVTCCLLLQNENDQTET